MNLDIFRSINNLAGQNYFTDGVMVFFAVTAVYILLAVAVVVAIYLLVKKQPVAAVCMIAACLLSLALVQFVGYLLPESRPFVDHDVNMLIKHAADQSFPSSHATMAFTLSLAVFWFSRLRIIGGAMTILAAVVGLARVFVGVHYPLDIIAGFGVSLISVLVVIGLSRILTYWHHVNLGKA
ncbi:MAG: phosphatase PAP2 family protein [bacterium]|nr:phosphatase PAP2 family protein [bacterium]MDN5835333.1 phosphatase PAP2 family protein [bacterium]